MFSGCLEALGLKPQELGVWGPLSLSLCGFILLSTTPFISTFHAVCLPTSWAILSQNLSLTHFFLLNLSSHTHIPTAIPTHTDAHALTHIHTQVHTYSHATIHTHTHSYIYTHILTIYTHAHPYTHTHTCTHTGTTTKERKTLPLASLSFLNVNRLSKIPAHTKSRFQCTL